MPFYEYQCPECGVEKEILHGINDKPEILCEQCKGANLQRLISAAGFRLKGGGWYETDFKGNGSKRNLAGDSSTASSSGSASDGASGGTSDASSKSSESSKSSSESKPAAKQASAD